MRCRKRDQKTEKEAPETAEEKAARGGSFGVFLLDINLSEDRTGIDPLRLLHEKSERDDPVTAMTA